MNEEELRNFNEALRAMSESLRKTGADLGDLSANLRALPGVFKTVSNAVNENTKAEQANTAAEVENTNVTKANAKAQQELTSVMGSLQAALGSATRSAFAFANALLSPEKNFSKFGAAIDGAADSAAGIANEFGILGKIVGAAIKAQAELSKAHLKQADDMYKGIDAINKMGAAGTMTVKGFTEMAHKVGYTSAELDKLTKPIESMKGGLISLGGTAGKGVKTFMELADVGEQTRRKFRNLGISQEELTQSQADYISLQRMSGKAISDYSKTTGQLKKDSLDYTKNLVELAALTGKSVEEAKKEQAAAQATFAMQIRNAKDASEIAKLDKIIKSDASASDKAAAKERLAQIEQERKVREKMTDSLTKSGLDITQIESFQTFLETGAKSEEFAKAFGSLQGLDVDDIRRRLLEAQRTGADTTAIMAEFETKYRDGVLKNVDRFGKNIMMTGEQAARELGVTSKNVTTSVARAGQDIGEAGKDVKKNIADAEKGKAGGEEDKMQKARNDLYEMQIREAVALDKMLLATNPIAEGAMPALLDVSKKFYDILMKIWNLLEKYWPILAGLFAGVAAFKIGKWAKTTADNLKDAWGKMKGFGRGGPPVPPAGPSAPSTPSAPVGKDGKPLRGAALKSAQEKAARVAAEEASKKAAQEAAEAAAKKSAGGMATKAAGALGKAAGAAGKFARFVPGVGTALSVGMGAYDAYKGFAADKDASLGERLKNAGSSALSGATFGMLGSSPEEIAARKAEKAAAPAETKPPATLAEMQAKAKEVAKTGEDPFAKYMSPETVKAQEEARKRIEENNKALAELTKKQNEAAAATKKPEEKKPIDAKVETDKAYQAFLAKQAELQQKQQDLLKTVTSGKDPAERKLAQELFEKTGLKTANMMPDDMSVTTMKFGDQIKLSDEALKDFGLQSKNLVDVQKITTKEFDALNSKLKDTGPATDKMMKDVAKNVETNTTSMFAGFGNMFKGMFGGNAGAAGAGGVVPKGSGGGAGAAPAGFSNVSMSKFISGGSSAMPSMPPVQASLQRSGGAASGGGSMPPATMAMSDPDAGIDSGAGDKQKVTSLPKNVSIGPGVDITGVDSPLMTAFYSAAAEFGRPIKINSAYRGDEKQAELWVRGRVLGEPGVHTPAKPKNDTKITYKGQEYNVPGSGKGSKHREGEALDISVDHQAFDPLLAKYGLNRPYKEKDPPHVEMLQAAKGGILSGPKSGFPAMLHGNEIVVPLDPNSLLAELGKKSKTEIENESKQSLAETKSVTTTSDTTKEMIGMNQALMEMLASKLDNMINKLDTSNDTQEKILKYSQA